jgi:transcription initiation factor TFIID subunit TAF12
MLKKQRQQQEQQQTQQQQQPQPQQQQQQKNGVSATSAADLSYFVPPYPMWADTKSRILVSATRLNS